MTWLIVFIGAGAGGVVRFWLGTLIQESLGSGFPWGTLTINVTGSFLLGFFYVMLEPDVHSVYWRLLLGIGFCGGYTTFSTFSYEVARLLESGDWSRAASYILGSVGLSLLATFAGFRIGDILLRKG